jgi:phage terminase large subunit
MQIDEAAQDAAVEAVFRAYGGSRGTLNPFVKYGGVALPEPRHDRIQFISKLHPLFEPHRYKVLKGGRGGVKSWGIARALLCLGQMKKLRIVCGREFMVSIEDSVYRLLCDQISLMGLSDWYKITKSRIVGLNGTTISFIGLGDMSKGAARTKIKSMESVDILWIEEAETVSDATWRIIPPTFRKAGSEIWISYNPNLEDDPTYKRFEVDPPSGTIVINLNWRENPWMSDELRNEKDYLFRVDAETAAHVWDGELRAHAEASILRNKYEIHDFDTPDDAVFYHGADFGYAADPSTLIRCFTTGTPGVDQELWIDWEEWELHCDIDKMPSLYDQCPTSRRWTIYGDAAAPQVINYLSNQGFAMRSCDKWSGSVEDGIAHLRGFVKIHIHKTRCPHTAQEAKLWRWKVDKISCKITPVPFDADNHCWDAIRYALNDFIQRRGVDNIWALLGKKTL